MRTKARNETNYCAKLVEILRQIRRTIVLNWTKKRSTRLTIALNSTQPGGSLREPRWGHARPSICPTACAHKELSH